MTQGGLLNLAAKDVDIGLPHATTEMLAPHDGAVVRAVLDADRLMHLEHLWNAAGREGAGHLASDILQ